MIIYTGRRTYNNRCIKTRKGEVLADKTWMETWKPFRTQFHHVPGFYPKTGFLRIILCP